MRRISRVPLALLTAVIPVVIAACYGVSYRFSQRGRVVDRSSRAPVPALRVECRDGGNVMTDMTRSADDGRFELNVIREEDCTTIRVEDDRGVAPRYQSATVPPDLGREITIEVGLQP